MTKTLHDLFVHLLSDTYSAEKQMTKALPKMARAASSDTLSSAFTQHLEETQVQVERLDQIAETSRIKFKRIKCVAMEGLIEEGKEAIDDIDKGPLLDVALIAAAQKVEHYEIASYGTLCTIARQLGEDDALRLLKETMAEEKATDEKLTHIAEAGANQKAAEAAA